MEIFYNIVLIPYLMESFHMNQFSQSTWIVSTTSDEPNHELMSDWFNLILIIFCNEQQGNIWGKEKTFFQLNTTKWRNNCP